MGNAATTMQARLSATWQKASQCVADNCVEVRLIDDDIQVRSSKQPDGASLSYDRDEWRTFVSAVKAGEFDV